MNSHANAKLTPSGRLLLVRRVTELGWEVARAARAAGVSNQTAHKWLNRFLEEGNPGLRDRRSGPKSLRDPRRRHGANETESTR
jgi:transposase